MQRGACGVRCTDGGGLTAHFTKALVRGAVVVCGVSVVVLRSFSHMHGFGRVVMYGM